MLKGPSDPHLDRRPDSEQRLASGAARSPPAPSPRALESTPPRGTALPNDDPWPPAQRATGRARPPAPGPNPGQQRRRPAAPGRVYGGQSPVPPPRTEPGPLSSLPGPSVPIAPGRGGPPPPPPPPAGIGVIGGRGRRIRTHGRRKKR